MNILLPGQYPRSEKLIAAARGYERGRTSAKELELYFEEDTLHFKDLQQGLSFMSSGLFNWQDLVRPFADLLQDAHANTLIRFYETNTFWRCLEVNKKTAIKENELEKWIDTYFFSQKLFAKDDPMVFTLPFLYLFQEFSKNFSLQQISNVLEIVAKKLLSFPNKTLCFFEPTFGWRTLSHEEKQAGKSLLESIKKSFSSEIHLITFFFSIGDDKEFLYSLPVDGIGIDFYVNPINCLQSFPQEKKVLAGIINTQSTLLESKESVFEFLSMLKDYIQKEKVLCIPNGPPELLPREIMDNKVYNLKEMVL